MPNPRRRTSEEQSIFGAHGESITPAKIWDSYDLTCHKDVAKMPVPAEIAEDKKKMALWNFLCSDLANRNLLTPTYLFTIRETVNTVALLDAYREQLEAEGPLVEAFGQKGQSLGQKMNPLFSAVNKLQALLLQYIAKLGLSPRDIHYLSNPDASPTEPIEAVVSENKRITYFRST